MDTKILVVGIVVALFVGAGAGYTLAPESVSSPELESQIEEYQSNIRTLENDKSDLQTSLSNAMSTNTELQSTLTSAINENTDLQNILSEAKNLFESVESQLSFFYSGFGPPDYDSGWTPIEPSALKNFSHGLGTKDDLFVYVIGRCSERGFNQYHYGFSYQDGNEYGCKWWVDDTTVYVERGKNDENYNDVRIYIWRIPQEPTEPIVPSNGDSIPETKYIPILLEGEETADISGIVDKIINLEGYKEVYISCYNYLKNGVVLFTWVIEDGESYRDVREILSVYTDDDVFAEYFGGLYRIQGKYLRVTVASAAYVEGGPQAYEEVRILLYATK